MLADQATAESKYKSGCAHTNQILVLGDHSHFRRFQGAKKATFRVQNSQNCGKIWFSGFQASSCHTIPIIEVFKHRRKSYSQ